MEQKSTKMDENTTKQSNTSGSNNLYNNYGDSAAHAEYPATADGCSSYDGYSYHLPGDGQALCQQYQAYEERGCWRKLYDYQTGHWYYQNLWTNTTQWMAPVGWETWPLNNQQESTTIDSETTSLSKFRKTSEEYESKNAEYMKRPARRQVEPEEAKKLHWRPEGANEYNIWYDRWIGDHWKGTRDDGIL